MTLISSMRRYLDAGFPIIYVHSFEDQKLINGINTFTDKHHVYSWSLADGSTAYSPKNGTWEKTSDGVSNTSGLISSLSQLKLLNSLDRSVILIKDAQLVLEDAQAIAMLRDLSEMIYAGLDCNIVLVSPVLKIPEELETYITILEDDALSPDEIARIIDSFVDESGLPELIPDLRSSMIQSFKGLSEYEIINLLRLALADDGELNHADLDLIREQKKQVILKSGTLEMVEVREKIDDIGGLDKLKEWLNLKSKVMLNLNEARKFGVDIPKGVLIAGVPGCGKSLCAKAAGTLFQVPVLRLDMGKLLGKYLGESETNMRRAIQLAENISPCILWVDELEKAFAGIGGGGHEVTGRLFGSFLTWLQEKTTPVFVVATANDISRLPPELLRKGRFDEIFFVTLPNKKEREQIFRIHIQKRRSQDLQNDLNISSLASQTEGFSGADIEGVIKDAVEKAFASNRTPLSTQLIMKVISETHPISEIMKDAIDKMISEYEVRKFKKATEN